MNQVVNNNNEGQSINSNNEEVRPDSIAAAGRWENIDPNPLLGFIGEESIPNAELIHSAARVTEAEPDCHPNGPLDDADSQNEHVLDTFQSDNIAPGDAGVVQSELRILSKFWGDDEDDDIEDTTPPSRANVDAEEEDFQPAILKSQRMKTRCKFHKPLPQQKALSRASPRLRA